jgi:tripartite ATP-independent transporter DctP family solute receptor
LNRFYSLTGGLLLLMAHGSGMADIRKFDLKAGTNLADDHPQTLAVKKFGEELQKLSNGKIRLKVFGAGALGSDMQMQSQLQGGVLDFAVPATGTLAGQTKEFNVLDFPFLFNSEEEADKVLDGDFGKKLLAKLPEKGLVGLGFWENGFRNTTNSKRPIEKWEDFHGLKIRTIQNTIVIDLFSGFGANAVPMAFNELFSALETKTVDAQENPLPVIATSKFYEVQKYLSLTRHSYTALVFLIGKKSWDKFNDEEKALLTEAANRAKDFQRRKNRELSAKLLDDLRKEGMQINTMSAAERLRMAARAKEVLSRKSDSAGKGVLDDLYAEIDKVRTAK